jgi:hypothetical protein
VDELQNNRGIPLDLLILVLFVMPISVGVFFGALSFRHIGLDVFHCNRCGGEFRRKAWRRFPSACAQCGARDWNL